MYEKICIDFHGRKLCVETGKIAKQASGAVVVTYDDNTALVTAVATDEMREGLDFVPLTVNYQEKFFASGKIPGGFFKREGRPTDVETLNCRLIDRPIRPLFPKGWSYETQIIPTVFSSDQETNPVFLAMLGASAALEVSDIPFEGPAASVQVARVDGQLVINPLRSQLEESDLELVVAGNRNGIIMVEGGARMVPEGEVLEALFYAQEQIQVLLDMQDKLREAVGKPKRDYPAPSVNEELQARIEELVKADLEQAWQVPGKMERHLKLKEIKLKALDALVEKDPSIADKAYEYWSCIRKLEKKILRASLESSGKRVDGRTVTEVRPIACEVGVLPRPHGSALFTRGETQAIVTTTLGTRDDEKRIEKLEEDYFKTFYLHYNFPPYCVGETSMRLGPGRREIGHGALAERAIARVLPSHDDFPYTIRVVSEITESNGSSSMASVCGGSLSLMDAGVPISAAVAGIAMGLVKTEDGRFHVLSDIMGDEDHLGDMDFKVAGTAEGMTAVQMDIKVDGITKEVLSKALAQAKEGRLHILSEMAKALDKPREDLSPYAPRIVAIQIPVDKIKDIIGPGGKVIKGMVEKTGATINVEDDGTVRIASVNGDVNQQVLNMIRDIIREAEIDEVYDGVVKRITDFGAFIEIFPGTEGLCHISELEHYRVDKVTDILREGDEVKVKCIRIDNEGKVALSRKALLPKPERKPADDDNGPEGSGRPEGDRDNRRPPRNRNRRPRPKRD